MQHMITVNGLGKRYRVGERRNTNFREAFAERVKAPLRLLNLRGAYGHGNGRPYIWALRNVDFKVNEGEIVGLVGSNGAGKSTVLKILSRITRPTEGEAHLFGRVRSLLEVGTGFHPELSGRENVFLNGAILGMRRREIQRKFDEIVAFAEVEKFLDTAVKHYSSGMYVRLAFAVAAFLEPEILLVDEVLAVGDARFWQKSTDKMRELNGRGMTIVLVTHNMWLIQTVCSRGILLKRGQIVEDGPPQLVIERYRRLAESEPLERDPEEGWHGGEITDLQVFPVGNWLTPREAAPDAGISLHFVASLSTSRQIRAYVRVTTPDSVALFTVYSEVTEILRDQKLAVKVTVPRLMLKGGEYNIWAGVCTDRDREEMLAQASVPLSIIETRASHPESGLFWNRAEWDMQRIN